MTNVIVNTIDVLGQEIDEGVVRISAADAQYNGGSLMLPEYHEQGLVAGSTTITGVTSGKVIITIHWDINRTATFRVFVPDTAEITLAELALQKYDTDPAIVSQVADSALRAEGAADRAEGVAEDFGSLEAVADQVHIATDAASSASGSASAAASSASAAASSESKAADSAAAAGTSAGSAASSASAAAGSASAAAGAADSAAGSESQAASSASDADSAATRAESVVDSTHWQDDRLSVMGQLGPSLKGPKGDPGDGHGDVLWSELNPVLDDKAPVSHGHTPESVGAAPATHTHVVAEITDLPEVTQQATAGAIVRRWSDSHITVPEVPSDPSNAAAKSYVDSRIQLVTGELPSVGEPGVLYVIGED